jgi:hypothetical protein
LVVVVVVVVRLSFYLSFSPILPRLGWQKFHLIIKTDFITFKLIYHPFVKIDILSGSFHYFGSDKRIQKG